MAANEKASTVLVLVTVPLPLQAWTLGGAAAAHLVGRLAVGGGAVAGADAAVPCRAHGALLGPALVLAAHQVPGTLGVCVAVAPALLAGTLRGAALSILVGRRAVGGAAGGGGPDTAVPGVTNLAPGRRLLVVAADQVASTVLVLVTVALPLLTRAVWGAAFTVIVWRLAANSGAARANA